MNKLVPLSIAEGISGSPRESKRDLAERLSALRLSVVGGLVQSGEVQEFLHLATDLLADVRVYDPVLHMAHLDALITRFSKARDGDARLVAAQAWVDGLSLLLSEQAGEGSAGKPAPERPPRLLVALSFGVLILLSGMFWYRHSFIDDVIFPNRSKRIADLQSITRALQLYHSARGKYPLSADGGKGWSGYLWSGTDENWIAELVPTYMAKLPHDPRNAGTKYMQYVYKSNGEDYKLLSLLPEDCSSTIAARPQLSDVARNQHRCTSYGYWTKAAGSW